MHLSVVSDIERNVAGDLKCVCLQEGSNVAAVRG